MGRLVLMDAVSAIAGNYKKIAEFLTVCRKCRYHCIYVFLIIAPDSHIRKIILFYRKLIFLTIFHRVYHTIPLLKVFKIIVDKQQKYMSLLVQFRLIGFLLTLPTEMNDIAY